MNPKTKTCGPDCTAKLHGRKEPEQSFAHCKHCGKAIYDEAEGIVCDECYSQYTPGMLADMDQ